MMLSDWDGDSKMIVLKIWSNVFISKDYIDTNNRILGVFSPLQQEIHIDVFDSLELCLTCLNLLFIFLIFRYLSCRNWLTCCFWIRFPSFSRCSSLRIWLSRSSCLGWSCTFLVILFLFLFFGLISGYSC